MTNDDVYNAALKYTNEYNWIVHPLSAPTDNKSAPGKRPLLKGWSNLKNPLSQEEIESYFKNQNVNIGVVCGKHSNLTIIDIDSQMFTDELLNDVDTSNFLMAKRTDERGHLYFKHVPDLLNYEYEYIKIDVRNDNDKGGGGNIVLPPSTHLSGDVYRFNKEFELCDIPEIPYQLKMNLLHIISLNKDLSSAVKKCRKWVREFLSSPDILHGRDGRRCMIALCAELKANDFTSNEQCTLISKIVYQKDYDEQKAHDQWSYVEPYPWKSERLMNEFPEYCNDKNTKGNIENKKENIDYYFTVIDDKKFKNLQAIYSYVDIEKYKKNGDIIYSCKSDDFYKNALKHDIIKENDFKKTNISDMVIDSIEKLRDKIKGMEIKDGKQPIYYINMDEGTLKFEPDTLLNMGKWREALLSSCKIVMGLRGKDIRSEFDDMVAHLIQDAKVIWIDEESEDDIFASIIYEEISKLIRVDSLDRFRRMEMACFENDNELYIKSSTLHRIMKNKNINMAMRAVREILRPKLARNSQQIWIDGIKVSVWFFKNDATD